MDKIADKPCEELLDLNADTEETAAIPAVEEPRRRVSKAVHLNFDPTSPANKRRPKHNKKARFVVYSKPEGRTVHPRSIAEGSRKAVDPAEREPPDAWDRLGRRKLAKLDGGQPVRGEVPLKEPLTDTLIKLLFEARKSGVANSRIAALVAEIRRQDPDFDLENASYPNGVAAKVNEVLGGTPPDPARLERDLANLPSLRTSCDPASSAPGPVSFWKRRTVQAIAALGLLGVIGGAYKIWEQLQPSPDKTEDLAKLADPVTVNTTTDTPAPTSSPADEESAPAATLYDEIGSKLETKTEGTDLSQGTKARIHAASTNDLTESLYDGAKQWETLDGQWLDTPQAHANVVKKLTTWGGYKDVLTVSANANTIDEMLENIADSNLPHAEYVAWKVATQIASIKDAEVVPSVEEVETRLNAVTPGTIDQVLDENIENPPPVPGPSFFTDQAEQTGSLDSNLYDAPEPVSLLAKVAPLEIQTPATVTIPAPRFEDRFDVIEPAHVKPVVQAKAETPVVPVFMDPTEAAEPVTLLAKREAEIPDVTEFLEEEPVPPPAPKPVPTLLENAKSALSSLTQMLKIPKIPRLW